MAAAAPPLPPRLPPRRAPLLWIAIGPVIGLFSLLTATGGPMIALPLLFRFASYWPDLPPREALVIANSLMVPVGACAALVALTRATFDLGLAALIGTFVSLGIPVGAHLARRLRPRTLRRLVALVLIFTGLSAMWKVTFP